MEMFVCFQFIILKDRYKFIVSSYTIAHYVQLHVVILCAPFEERV